MFKPGEECPRCHEVKLTHNIVCYKCYKEDPGAPEKFLYMPLQQSTRRLHDLLEKKNAEERKQYPVKTGFLDYFRDAVFRVAHVSYVGNQQHSPGQSTHWARGKSPDQLDCLIRHVMCGDDEEHLASAAWRALAELQLFLEKKYGITPPPGCK